VAGPRSEQHAAFGAALRDVRVERGLSQEGLAALCRLDRTYVSGIERGERNPSLANLLRLAAALETPLSALMLRAETRNAQ
jgi:transcriptional regulator with XRE-family HTH domain